MIEDALYCMKQSAGIELCEECKRYYECDHTLMEENARYAVDALEKQIPKKLVRNIFDRDSKICCCGNSIDIDDEFEFCPCCGQRLDWSE